MRLTDIAKQYDLKLISLTEKNFDAVSKRFSIIKAEAINNAYLLGDYVILGFYDDREIKRASFFHELGHSLISEKFERLVNRDDMLIEYQAWIIGLKEAKKYGMFFSGKTFKYILKSINSYYDGTVRTYNKRNARWNQKNS